MVANRALKDELREMEDQLRQRLDVSDRMHPDHPESVPEARGTMLWFQAASWLIGAREEELVARADSA
jgi:hypothetical protein